MKHCIHFNVKLIELTHNESCYINNIALWHRWEIQIAFVILFDDIIVTIDYKIEMLSSITASAK